MKKKVLLGVGGGILVTAIMTASALFLSSGQDAGKGVLEQDAKSMVAKQVSTKNTSADKKEKDGLTIHFQWDSENGEFPHLYYEDVDGKKTNMTEPGVPMKEEREGWYAYTIPEADSAKIKISVPSKGYQTTLQEKKGDDWWFAQGGWFKEDPQPDAKKKTEKVTSGAVQNAATGKVTVHCYSEDGTPSLYYWNALPEDKEVAWPGEEMKKESDNWYSYTFEDTTKINVLFLIGKNQTEDFTATNGEWWYNGSEWTKNDPTKTPTPRPTRDPNHTVSTNDFREESIYFVMTTRFFDGDPSNNIHCEHDAEVGNGDDDPAWRGDFKGLIEKLDYIKALGFSAVWVTPVVENASGYDYHGYHALDFKKVDPRYESEGASYQDLIDACHAKGMKLIQDVVFNHTSQYGEQGLCELFDQEYVLDKGVSGNSTKLVRTDNGKLDTAMTQASVETNNNPSSDYDNVTGNNPPYAQYIARVKAIKDGKIYRNGEYCGRVNYETFEATTCQIDDNCQELNTENPKVYKYLIDAYSQYISWGVDAFRIDTMKHVSRMTFNKALVPGLQAAAKEYQNKDNFYMFGEVCTRKAEVFNQGNARVSPFYYTWKEEKDYPWNDSSEDGADNLKACEQAYNESKATRESYTDGSYGLSDNTFLNGNEYHKPDYTNNSGLGVIDYTMHINFTTADGAYQKGLEEDKYFNDSTYNVVYVDSHDYGPNVEGRDDSGHDKWRYGGGTEAWAENLNLMFTFRGIPCLYYGSEVEFMKDAKIDAYDKPLAESGRAYFGDYIEGSVTTSDFGVYSGATGAMADTLSSPLAKHLSKVNRIRRAVPALQKGQYSTEGVSGGMAFKRRYTDEDTDSFVCVAITNGATFSGIPGGTYIDVVSGDKKEVGEGGTLTIAAPGKGNMRVYVLQNQTAEDYGANGKIGELLQYLK